MAIEKLDARTVPEQWRIVAEFPDYEVSNHGNVRRATPGRNTAPGRPLKAKPNFHGYPYVVLCGPGLTRKARTVHRLVAEAFLPREEGCEFVHHINHDKIDAHVDNLEWVTRTANSAYAIAAGRLPVFDRKGSANGNSKLVEWQVRKIRSLYTDGMSITRIADRYGMDRQHIWMIVNRKVWKHLD